VIRLACVVWLVISMAAALWGQSSPVHIESLAWVNTYSGRIVRITGVVVNDSNQSLSGIYIHWNLHVADRAVVGNASDFVQVLPPAERWRFSAAVDTADMIARPVYVQGGTLDIIGSSSTITVDSPEVWDPIVLKAEEKARKKAAKKAKKTN